MGMSEGTERNPQPGPGGETRTGAGSKEHGEGERGMGMGNIHQDLNGWIQYCLVPILQVRPSLSSNFFSSSCHPANTALTCLVPEG